MNILYGMDIIGRSMRHRITARSEHDAIEYVKKTHPLWTVHKIYVIQNLFGGHSIIIHYDEKTNDDLYREAFEYLMSQSHKA